MLRQLLTQCIRLSAFENLVELSLSNRSISRRVIRTCEIIFYILVGSDRLSQESDKEAVASNFLRIGEKGFGTRASPNCEFKVRNDARREA